MSLLEERNAGYCLGLEGFSVPSYVHQLGVGREGKYCVFVCWISQSLNFCFFFPKHGTVELLGIKCMFFVPSCVSFHHRCSSISCSLACRFLKRRFAVSSFLGFALHLGILKLPITREIRIWIPAIFLYGTLLEGVHGQSTALAVLLQYEVFKFLLPHFAMSCRSLFSNTVVLITF